MRRLLAAAALAGIAPAAHAADCVVLLHGLGRSEYSMAKLEYALRAEGYLTWNEGYPSTKKPIEELAPVIGVAVDYCRGQDARRVHFVTHSLGGILVRAYFQDHSTEGIGRVVMLAPPSRGSEVVDRYRETWWFRHATGPAGQQLGTDPESVPIRLARVDLEIGVIAGRRSSDPWFGGLFPGAHDGKVSVERAALPEMKDLLVVDSGHTFIMNSAPVIAQVLRFLKTGAFDGAAAPVTPP